MNQKIQLKSFWIVGVLFCGVIFAAQFSDQTTAHAQSDSDLQSKIDQHSQDIKSLEAEIAGYQKQLVDLGSQSSTLSSAIKTLQLTQKKLEADIKVTENKIIEKNLQIFQLGSQISDKEDNISDDTRIISRSFITMNEMSDRSLPELLLTKNSLSQAWHSLEEISAIQKGLSDKVDQLRNVKAGLETNRKATEKAKTELQALGSQLKGQRDVVLSTTAQQNQLLKETKQSETEYQKILAQRKALKESFENELAALEATLKGRVDAGSIPDSGRGVLAYPVDVVWTKRITQYFGNTEFATANPQIYAGRGHTGIDFGVPIGTSIKSAAVGIVVGTGNTDLACPRASYGKWVMVDHGNGLNTVYGHLSAISVTVGQSVKRGETIAYSGNTGQATGPHLHFEVSASDGVTVGTYNFKSCAGARIQMPLVTKQGAHLNPLSYL